jgi:predicted ATPase/transcriptional regulator with XRE-family HTH domain
MSRAEDAEASFGQLLRRHRRAVGLTQEALAERAGLSRRGIQHLEANESGPYPDTVRRLLEVLRLPSDERAAFEVAARRQPAGSGRSPVVPQATLAGEQAPPTLGRASPDLAPPEPVFQVVQDGLSAEFPPLVSPDGRPNNLPAHTTALLGRDEEVARVRERLVREDVRLITLTGTGGTGKTRLGLEVAAELIDRFPDGVFFVSLAPISDYRLVSATIALALEIRDMGARPALESLKEYVRGRQMLLVLDNFEQVLPAAPVVGELLETSPALNVLVTSRAPVELRGEHEFAVPPLALPDLQRLPPLDVLSGYGAVALFVERAMAINADFAITNENAAAIAEIFVRLDGLPLAIELAAARLRLLSPQALLTRLERRLPLLTGGARDLPARQQTLRGTIAWSYDLLDERERVLFRRLSIFVGGCTLDAAAAVCDVEGDLGSDVLDRLGSLVAKSLLRRKELPDGESHLSILETIREYATEQLEASGEETILRDRHLDYYVDLARIAEGELRGPPQADWFNRLERENDNLRAALEWSYAENSTRGQAPAGSTRGASRVEAGSRLADDLEFFWVLRGHARENLPRVLALLARALPRSEARARALTVATFLRGFTLGEYQAALPLADEAVAIWRSLDNPQGLAVALVRRAQIAVWATDYQHATTLYDEAHAIFRRLGDDTGLSGVTITHHLATLAQVQGDHDRAVIFHNQALAETQARGDHHGVGYTLRELARVRRAQGRDDEAILRLRESLRLFGPLKDIR